MEIGLTAIRHGLSSDWNFGPKLEARRVLEVPSKARNVDYEILRYRGKGSNGWIWAGID